MEMRPHFLTPEQAGEAFEAFVLPSIQSGIEGDHVGGQALYLCALDLLCHSRKGLNCLSCLNGIRATSRHGNTGTV